MRISDWSSDVCSSDLVIAALDYLIASNRKGFGDAVPAFDDGRLDAKDRHVVVIGGGDTAMDCVRTAGRQDRKRGGVGKSVFVPVDSGGLRIIQKITTTRSDNFI